MTVNSEYYNWLHNNRRVWEEKPLLRQIYGDFHRRIRNLIDLRVPGRILEIGGGIGSLKSSLPETWTSDLFPNPWLDLACDAYELPLVAGSISHVVLVDVFHHLAAPAAFMQEVRRVLAPGGRLILLEPYISLSSCFVYGLLHPEPIAWRQPIDQRPSIGRPRTYYAAQGNATRLFFRRTPKEGPLAWVPFHREAFCSFTYLLSGGFSRPAFYPVPLYPFLQRVDRWLSRWPRLFGARCLVGFQK
jgi:SAM-dependent methyltransferase